MRVVFFDDPRVTCAVPMFLFFISTTARNGHSGIYLPGNPLGRTMAEINAGPLQRWAS